MTTQPSTKCAAPQGHVRSPTTAPAGTLKATKSSIDSLRYAFTFLLSVVAVGSATAQSFNDDIWMRASTQASRARINNEILQARADGTIKRWAPTLVEVPLKSGRSRAYPLRDYPADVASTRATATSEPAVVGRESHGATLTVGE